MQLNNVWGLLALLSLPAILALHFFRSRRQTKRIGGLHLWHDAPTRLPVGRNWDRLLRNLALLFQLLAALLLSLLIAGLDLPTSATQRHYTLILDDSASMRANDQAGKAENPARRAEKMVRGWAPRRARFTVVAAGSSARVLAGPFASRDELFAALSSWQPAAPACNLESAVALASRFAGPTPSAAKAGVVTDKLLLLTDSATTHGRETQLETGAFGRPLANQALIFADRIRLASSRDRILLTVRNFSAAAVSTPLRAAPFSAGQLQAEILNRQLDLPVNGPLQFAFETPAINETIRIWIGEDALALDNTVTLDPVPVKFVRVARIGLGDSAEAITQAMQAVPYTLWAANPAEANLVLTDDPAQPVTSATRVLAVFADLPTTAPARVVTGNDLRAEPGAELFLGVDFNGALWPCFPGALVGKTGIELWGGDEPLARRRELKDLLRYDFNLRLAASNLPKQPAWPLLARNLVELSRAALPGLSRANFNAGEPVRLNFPDAAGPCQLTRDGAPFQRFDEPPRVLPDLPVGAYALLNQDKPIATFQVNLSAPAESDLQGIVPRRPELGALAGGQIRAATVNPIVYYALLLGAIAAVAGAWACQDRSR